MLFGCRKATDQCSGPGRGSGSPVLLEWRSSFSEKVLSAAVLLFRADGLSLGRARAVVTHRGLGPHQQGLCGEHGLSLTCEQHLSESAAAASAGCAGGLSTTPTEPPAYLLDQFNGPLIFENGLGDKGAERGGCGSCPGSDGRGCQMPPVSLLSHTVDISPRATPSVKTPRLI